MSRFTCTIALILAVSAAALMACGPATVPAETTPPSEPVADNVPPTEEERIEGVINDPASIEALIAEGGIGGEIHDALAGTAVKVVPGAEIIALGDDASESELTAKYGLSGWQLDSTLKTEGVPDRWHVFTTTEAATSETMTMCIDECMGSCTDGKICDGLCEIECDMANAPQLRALVVHAPAKGTTAAVSETLGEPCLEWATVDVELVTAGGSTAVAVHQSCEIGEDIKQTHITLQIYTHNGGTWSQVFVGDSNVESAYSACVFFDALRIEPTESGINVVRIEGIEWNDDPDFTMADLGCEPRPEKVIETYEIDLN